MRNLSGGLGKKGPASDVPGPRRVSIPLVAAREAATLLRSAMWPFARLNPLPPVQRGAGRVPVVLVHGYLGHPGMLRPIQRRLLEEGWDRITLVRYPSTVLTLEQIAGRIADVVLPLAAEGPVDLVGHSLGALASRAWIKLLGGAPHVRRFVSLGGPHAGTSLYRIVPSPVREAFDPKGPWVTRLMGTPEPVPTTVIRARYDHQVFPPQRARISGVHEVIIDAHGHNGLLWSTKAHDAVVHALLEEVP